MRSDSKALLSLFEDARKYKVSLGDLAWGDYPFTQNEIDLRLKNGSCYAVEQDGKLIGSITLIWEDERNWGPKGLDSQAGYIHGLMVSGDYRGKGLGEQMIDWAAMEIKNNGRRYVRLDCPAANQGLRAYYQNLGFTPIDVGHNPDCCNFERAV